MKLHNLLVASTMLAASFASATLLAEVTLPSDNERERWHEFINTFAECSAVYNLAATIKDRPEKGVTTTYRELANNALISGMMSAEKVKLDDGYLESIYSVKMGLWEPSAKDKARQAILFERASYCVSEVLPYQNAIIGTLRSQTAKK